VPLLKIGEDMPEVFEKVNSFIEKMLQWETEFHKKRRSDAYNNDDYFRSQSDEEARKILLDIFSEHLSERALKGIAQARLDTLGTAHPPEYDQLIDRDTENFDRITGFIEAVNKKGFKQRYKYFLIIDQGILKIDSVRVWRSSTGKWEIRNSI
jgi:hypothetical protein